MIDLSCYHPLRVWPPLEKDKKGLVKHASHQAGR
jgi:hypothetical protein